MNHECLQVERPERNFGSGEKPVHPPGGLTGQNFRKIAPNGFGDPYNSYPHSMIWFKDHLYVGTTRGNIHLLWFTMGENVSRFSVWPVQQPANPYDLDLRGQIWRYNPRTGEWRQIYLSPMLMGKEGFEVPLSIGFRGITVFQGKSDPEPALYCTTWASSKGPGPVLLRSFDGVDFDQVSRPGLGDPTVATIRAVVPFQGKLFLSPTGTTKGKYLANVPDKMVILVNKDPEKDDWQLACEPFFGDSTNMGIFDMATFHGHLYAATSNSATGFQIWKTKAEGAPPYTWRKVMSHGGYRGKENQGVGHLYEFKGCLYIGTGILGGYDRERNIGPASPELFRLYPDDTWDLIVGEPRLTPVGLKIPLSGLGAGYNSPTVGYFWRMCEHEGWLYLGTYDWSIWMPYVRPETIPEKLRQMVERVGVDNILRAQAGFDLWRSRDGVTWVPVSRNGFGNKCNYGVRTMASSSYGLFVGVANPFGPTMAVRRLGGWRYEPNEAGGCEVWLGSHDFPGDFHPSATLLPYEVGGAQKESLSLEEMAEEMIAGFYGGSGFRHCGFWGHSIKTPQKSCENLVYELLALLPEDAATLLEVGCGAGATTQAITERLPAVTVTGTVATPAELAACKQCVPMARFHLLKPTKLKLAGAGFDAAVCVEGPSAAQPARKFFQAVHGALNPGGVLAFADLLVQGAPGAPTSLDEYEALLTRSGFGDIQLWDVTSACWKPFQTYNKQVFWTKLLAGEITQNLYDEIMSRLPGQNQPVNLYVIGRARKIENLRN
jgi:cyclopropane fatty-acyl-phospholipid synthase-like methyltransferase